MVLPEGTVFDITENLYFTNDKDITKRIATPEKSTSVDFSDAILAPVPDGAMNRLKGLLPEG